MTGYPARAQPSHEEYCLARGCAHRDTTTPNRALTTALAEDAPVRVQTARYTVKGTDLCNWHHAQFPRVLGDLVGLYADLSVRVYRRQGNARDANSGRRSQGGHMDAGAWWNPAASTVLYELTDWTRFLTRVVLNEHPLPPETVREYIHNETFWDEDADDWVTIAVPHRIIETPTHSLSEDADVRLQLAAHARWYARWLSGYPFLGSYLLEDAIDHRRAAMAALESTPVRRILLQDAYCHEYLYDHPTLGPMICGGKLAGILDPSTDVFEASRSRIVCTTNPQHKQLDRTRWMDFA